MKYLKRVWMNKIFAYVYLIMTIVVTYNILYLTVDTVEINTYNSILIQLMVWLLCGGISIAITFIRPPSFMQKQPIYITKEFRWVMLLGGIFTLLFILPDIYIRGEEYELF